MKKTVTIAVVALALVYIAAFTVISMTSNPVSTELVRQGVLENSVQVEGIVVREEWVYTSEEGGVFESPFADGARVNAGEKLGTVYFGEVSSEAASQLKLINQEITQLEAKEEIFENGLNDPEKIKTRISDLVGELVNASVACNGKKITELQNEISQLHDRRLVLEGKKQEGDSELNQLYSQKAELEAGLRAEDLYSQQAGVFTYLTDGFETRVGVSALRNLMPGDVDTLLETEISDPAAEFSAQPVAKVVNNFKWYFVFNLTVQQLDTLKVGDEVNLRFSGNLSESIPAKIATVSQEENGRVCVSVSCMNDVKAALTNRKLKVELIKQRYEGSCFSRSAVRVRDEVSGVYVVKDGVAVFCPVNILYGTDETVIISSEQTAENQVKLYDEIINEKTSDIKEGELLR
ncbi:MAG: HlyD family efflux transporter periplasmic adaptor subunit [Clostridia bacterium]|nr:HlyD family efflux transporter periplasmic adaptor subunit [Clostridia bacterium]